MATTPQGPSGYVDRCAVRDPAELRTAVHKARAGDPWALCVVRYQGPPLSYTDFSRLRLEAFTFNRTGLDGCSFRESRLVNVGFNDCSMRRADFRNLPNAEVGFTRTDLRGADFRGSTFRELVLDHVDLRGARLDGVDFRCTRLDDAYVSGVMAHASDLAGCYISPDHEDLITIIVDGQPSDVATMFRELLQDWGGTAGEALATATTLCRA